MLHLLFGCADVTAGEPKPAPGSAAPASSASDRAAPGASAQGSAPAAPSIPYGVPGYGGTSFRADARVVALSMTDTGELVTLDAEGAILRFALPSGERLGAVTNPCESPVYSQAIAVSPHGTLLAVGCANDVRITRVGSGRWDASGDVSIGGLNDLLVWNAPEDVLTVNGSGTTLLGPDAHVLAHAELPAPLLPIADDLWMGTYAYDGEAPVKGWSPTRGELWSKKVPLGTYEAVRGIASLAGEWPLAVLTDREIHWFKKDGTFVSAPSGIEPCCDGPVAAAGEELWVRRGTVVSRVRKTGVVGEVEAIGRTLVASPDGRYVAATDLARVQVWQADGTALTPTDGLVNDATQIRWSADGSAVAATDGDRVVRLDRATGKLQVQALRGVEHLAWAPSGVLVLAGRTGTWLWDHGATAVPLAIDGSGGVVFEHGGVLRALRIATDAGAEERRMARWTLSPLARLSDEHADVGLVGNLGLSPDGARMFAIPTSADPLCIADARAGTCQATFDDVDDAVWLGDGTLRVASGVDENRDNAELWTWPGDPPRKGSGWPPVPHAVLAPDGRTTAGWKDGALTVWDIPSHAVLHTWRGPGPVRMRFAPDSRSVALTAGDGLLRIVPSGR
jgi:WD40 repeat protein